MQVIMQVIVFSGVNHTPTHIAFTNKQCLTKFKTMYCFMWMIMQDDFQIILKQKL